METVLHDVPDPSQGHHHDLQRDLDGPLHASTLVLRNPLRLIDLLKDVRPRVRTWALRAIATYGSRAGSAVEAVTALTRSPYGWFLGFSISVAPPARAL